MPISRHHVLLAGATTLCVVGGGLIPTAALAASPPAGVTGAPAPALAQDAIQPPAIIVTEILANTAGADDFEYVEVHNTTDAPIDLGDEGFTFAYTYVDSDDRTSDVPLALEESFVLAAGETAVLWLSYTSGSVDSYAHSVEDFRAYYDMDAAAQVVRMTGQPGMANGGNRGIRVLQDDAIVSWSHYPTSSMGNDLSVHFRLPVDRTARSLEVLGQQAEPSPGAVLDEAVTWPADAEEPVEDPAANWPLIVTEIGPDNTGYDDYEFFEVHNPTSDPIDLSAGGFSFAYSYVDSGDRTRDVALTIDGDVVIEAGETVVFWLNYTTTTVDSFVRSEQEFRAHWGMPGEPRVFRVTGQSGMANGGDRGIRVLQDDAIVGWSHYPSGSVSVDQTAHFRIPADVDALGMALLEGNAAATPGTIADEALTAPEPEPEPEFDPQPDPSVTTAPLQITELLPDSTNVGTADGYEFVEVYNATSETIDFGDYTINYLYATDEHTATSETRWPAVPANVEIPAGETLVLWVKNGQNDDLGDTEFNAHFGSELILGENLVEVFMGGMANGSPRGLEILTDTGYTVNRAYYNLGSTDDSQPDQGIRYTAREDDLTLQRMLGLAPATPGAVQSDQVPAGLMIEAADTQAPEIEDLTVDQIDPAADFTLSFRVTDDVRARSVTLTLGNNADGSPLEINLEREGDDTYAHTISAADLTGKSWYEYSLRVSDGANVATLEPQRVAVEGASSDPVRLNIEEGEFVAGERTLVAAGDAYPSPLGIEVDGEALETQPGLEDEPMFVFEATNVDYYFKNGVLVGDEVLRIFDTGISSGWETIATPVPLDYVVQGDELVVSVWAGTKKAPEIDPAENNDDFNVRGLRLVLPDGRTLTPAGYDDPSQSLSMGDSAGKYESFDARFTLPDDAFAAVTAPWDTTVRQDGPAVVAATGGDEPLERTVTVDNTAPVVTSSVVDGTPYQGEIRIEAEAVDAGAGVESVTATLDGAEIELPYTTSSVDLAAGDHALVVTASDALANASTYEATFTTFEEQPSAGAVLPEEGAEVEAGDVTLQAAVEDPTGDLLDVSFFEGSRLDLSDGDVSVQSGTVNDALDTARAEPLTMSAREVEAFATDDGVSHDVSSDTEFPYQLFEIEVGDDVEPGTLVRATWSGRANEGARVLMYVMDADGAGWTEVDRHDATDSDEAFTLDATPEAAAYARDGVVTVLIQHSEGFAGEDLSDRTTEVVPNNAEDVPRTEYDFTFGWESDTQYYNENTYPGENIHDHQVAIHDYFLDQRDELNLQYVFHTGDIVDDYDQLYQWTENADPQYTRLDEAGLPYGVLAGNHDVGNHLLDYTNYGAFFGEQRYAGNPWYGGSYADNRGHYDLISAGGIDFVMVYMGWGPADAEIAWMNEVLAQYPDRVAVLAQHEFILTTGGLGAIPQRILDEVVAVNPNVKMVFSGHYHDAFTRTDSFDDDGDGTDDRTVYSMLFDYQGLDQGGLGYLRLLHFDNEGERMLVRTYSPSLDVYNSDEPSLLGPADDPYVNQEFELTYAQLGITPGVRTLGTDAFAAEILTANEIGSFTDVPSGSVVTATWPLAEVGEHGWYVRTADPYGAVDYSPVSLFSVFAAAEPEEPTDPEPGDGDGAGDGSGDGADDGGGAGDGAGDGDPVTGSPAGSAGDGGGSDADGLANTGSDGAGALGLAAIALALLAGGAGILVGRRRLGARRG